MTTVKALGRFEKGEHASKKTEFTKGFTPWNKGIKGLITGWLKGKRVDRNIYPRMGAFGKRTPVQIKRISDGLKGRKAWNKGLGTITSENNRARDSIEFRLWREAVFARDAWTCQKCNEVGNNLHPHHIINFAEVFELRFAIDNGVTLCKKHHKEFHKLYGQRKNNKEQLKEFLEAGQEA